MRDTTHERLTQLFLRSLDQDPASLATWLSRVEPVSMRRELRKLLEAHHSQRAVVRTGRHDPAEQPPAPPPPRVGGFEIQEKLGEGGMGVVYRATQTDPVERQVAVKFLRTESVSDEAWRDFDFERRTLARLSHINITRLIDAGATATARPYVVMEFVEGVPITEYVASRREDIHGTLHLFLQLCSGIEHAHRHAVVHRDIKPNNVLISIIDGDPVVKIIDFGISLALDGQFRADALLSGTPGYMVPDISGSGDTQSDVYALGILLSELLTVVGPRQFGSGGDVRPSALVDERSHRRRLRGDLDAIVLAATEPTADDRYSSVEALRRDIQCFLEQYPVSARRPSTRYRLTRFWQRNRAAATGSILGMLALLLLAWQAVSLVLAKENARENERIARDA
ncbi:MAG: serine/threonine-protein kinase, partial [Planctomycetota bacterium]